MYRLLACTQLDMLLPCRTYILLGDAINRRLSCMCRRREEEGTRVRELRSGAGLLNVDPVLRQ